MFAPPAFFPLPPMPERVVRQYVPPPMPTYVDPNAPVLPPPSFSSPEGNYTLIPNMMTNATLLPPPMPIPSGPPATGFGGMSPAMAMAGMGMGGIPPGMFGMGGGPPASASPVAPGGPVAGPAFGQGNGTNGVPNPWPIRANFVTFSINGNGKAGNEGNNQSSGGFGGLLGRGGAKKQEQQQQQAVKKTDNAGSSDEDEDDSAQNKLQYEATYGARGPGGKSRLPPRPKNNLRSTNSSFVTRVSASESFSRLVSNPPHLDPTVYSASHFSNTPPRGSNPPVTHWAFMNTGRTLVWAYVDPTGKQKEPIMRMWFSANITAHAVCETTKVAPGLQGERLDIMVGFATGDLVWVDPIFGKYTRFSKGGIVHPFPIAQIRWHPRIPTIFYVLYTDGNIFTFSTEKEDPPYLVTTVAAPWAAGMRDAVLKTEEEAQARPVGTHGSILGLDGTDPASAAEGTAGLDAEVKIEIERQRAKRAEMMFIWKNEEQVVDKKVLEKQHGGGGGLMSWAGRNPSVVWKVGVKGVRQMEFSPDGQVLAVISEDGTLKLIDVNSSKIMDVYAGYYGALTTLVWSPDGRYVLTGGQDDLITIYSPIEGRIVARCQGHTSYVTSITFDRRRSNARGYRFGSVGEDGKILFWDFSAASLQRPRHGHAHHRLSIGSVTDLTAGGRRDETQTAGDEVALSGGGTYHGAPLRSDVAMLQPVMTKLIEPCMMNQLNFLQEAVVTVSRAGGIKFWARPADLRRLLKSQQKERSKSPGRAPAPGLQAGMRNLRVSATTR